MSSITAYEMLEIYSIEAFSQHDNLLIEKIIALPSGLPAKCIVSPKESARKIPVQYIKRVERGMTKRLEKSERIGNS